MARNSEKAQSMLYRFRASQAADSGLLPTSSTRRPKAASTIDTVPACEKFRGQILRDVSRKLLKIQDESLSDAQLRDLNDEINKLMKEKWSWERRIRELGGPNYMRSAGGVMFDEQGNMMSDTGGKGYRYFGRAKELPGVKEMFERAAKRQARKDKGGAEDDEVGVKGGGLDRRGCDARYFGYRDESGREGEALLRYERRKEREAEKRLAEKAEESEDEEWQPLPGDAGDGIRWRLPTVDEVNEELVRRRGERLLEGLG